MEHGYTVTKKRLDIQQHKINDVDEVCISSRYVGSEQFTPRVATHSDVHSNHESTRYYTTLHVQSARKQEVSHMHTMKHIPKWQKETTIKIRSLAHTHTNTTFSLSLSPPPPSPIPEANSKRAAQRQIRDLFSALQIKTETNTAQSSLYVVIAGPRIPQCVRPKFFFPRDTVHGRHDDFVVKPPVFSSSRFYLVLLEEIFKPMNKHE